MNLCQPSEIRRLMEEAGIRFRQEYGQNFLTDPSVPARIAEACAEEAESFVLEIGPGIGSLTRELAERYARVVAVEIDGGLIPVLEKTVGSYGNLTVLHEDAMKTDLGELVRTYGEGRRAVVCANLPYYITTPILMRLLESEAGFSSLTVMVQSEVAERLTAGPGERAYGAITAVLGYYGGARRLFRVPAGCFLPVPKVDSAVIRVDLYPERPFRPQSEKLFFGSIRAAFGQRRKTLLNALGSMGLPLTKEALSAAIEAAGQSPNVRGERLSTADFVRLSDALFTAMQQNSVAPGT